MSIVNRGTRARAYVIAVIVTLGLVGVARRAWSLQVDDGDRYRALAERQHDLHVAIPAPRGEIVDARGRTLAVSTDVDSVWANPHEVHDVAATAEQLAKILGASPTDGGLAAAPNAVRSAIDEQALEAKLGGAHKFVWIARHVTPELARAIAAAKLPGIELVKEPRRWYPGKSVAGPVIGRADLDGNGVDGIELAMNAQLAGHRGDVSALRDARGHTMMVAGDGGDALPGATVHLTLDRSIQALTESALAEAVAAHQAKAGVAVVIDVATSRVLAMASEPTYDPNDDDAHGRNLAVTDAFEAGSIMKVFSVATALEDGVVEPDTEFPIGGQFVVGRRAITDVEYDAYLTTSGIIRRSSNVGAAKIALRLGAEKLHAGLEAFGFAHRTGIELPGERMGTVRRASEWRDIDLAHIAFGYGLTVTPLQVAAAFAAIANHGIYHEPRIVDSVVDRDDTVTYRGQGAAHRAVSEKTAAEMMAMLVSVFDKGPPAARGTAHAIDVPGFRCAGKTGTARRYDPEAHKYSDRYLASFAGLAPAAAPRIAVVVMIDQPTGGGYYGAEVSGPVFARVASETLRYLGVPGDPLPPAPPAHSP